MCVEMPFDSHKLASNVKCASSWPVSAAPVFNPQDNRDIDLNEDGAEGSPLIAQLLCIKRY